ncbi:unnamed protein product [marine sediment metagenome]|uniref:Uncharacterized protein n=1 Tax=marine sediment metagenome TaxID=412755 RepID=X1VX12_9ZZZZ
MEEIKDWLLLIGIIVGTTTLVYRTPRLRHLIAGQTTMINGRVVRDPRDEYVSK